MSQAQKKTGILWFVPSGDEEIRTEQEGHEAHACLQEHQPGISGRKRLLCQKEELKAKQRKLCLLFSGDQSGAAGEGGGDGSVRLQQGTEFTLVGFGSTSGAFRWIYSSLSSPGGSADPTGLWIHRGAQIKAFGWVLLCPGASGPSPAASAGGGLGLVLVTGLGWLSHHQANA